MKDCFIKAKAVWAKDKSLEMNLSCFFYAQTQKNGILRITGSSFYRVFLNGELIGYGPARAAHGVFRIDEYSLNSGNIVIEAVGYNSYGYYQINQPSFLQAEIIIDDQAVFATGYNIHCAVNTAKIQKVLKYSWQRAFCESYEYSYNPYIMLNDPEKYLTKSEIEEINFDKKYLMRKVPLPKLINAEGYICETGIFKRKEKAPHRDRYMVNDVFKIFRLEELEVNVNDDVSSFEYELKEHSGYNLKKNEYTLWDFYRSYTGFIDLKIDVNEDCFFYLIFDEIDYRENIVETEPKNISFYRNTTTNILSYRLKKGTYRLTSFEPYSLRYLKLALSQGLISVKYVGIVRYENIQVNALKFECNDEKLQLIVDAARNTLAQNSVDLLTDCPSRERAGWLCDSYFSARAEKLFCGNNDVEKNFLENFVYYDGRLPIPKGVLPMCYPSDAPDGCYLPNWSLWYILELEDYLKRTGDSKLIELSKDNVLGIIRYFDRYLNDDGLLENLEGWVFIEWSKANDDEFIKGVNYPCNMLYSKALETAGKLYGIKHYIERASSMREIIRTQSFNGEFFEDNCTRQNGRLIRTGHVTETCQYYAFFFGVAEKDNYKKLFNVLISKFGARRDDKTEFSFVYKSNAFIGNYLRLDYLVRNGYYRQVLNECIDYFYKMASITATLWEHDSSFASLNHGFASYVANLIVECITGYKGCDDDKKEIYLLPLQADYIFSVNIPINGGYLEIKCHGKNNIEINNNSGYKIVKIL